MRARPLIHFMLAGALLFGARQAIGQRCASDRPELVVRISGDATDAERRRATDEALLLDLAQRSGWVRSDPVVRDRLVRNMRFAAAAEEAQSDVQQLERALSLGMHRTDAVVRQRLIGRARRALLAAPSPTPTQAELVAYAEAHRQRYATPAAASFSHIFLSAQRRGVGLAAAARALDQRLQERPPPPRQGRSLSDPSLLPHDLHLVNARRIDASFGAGFASALSAAPSGRWSGPLPSSFGLHYVWVHAQMDPQLPALALLRPRLLRDLRHDRREARLRRSLDRLRARYSIKIEGSS